MKCSECSREIGYRPYVKDPVTKVLGPALVVCPNTGRAGVAVDSGRVA